MAFQLLGLSPIGLACAVFLLVWGCKKGIPLAVRCVERTPLKTNIYLCTGAFCCTSAFWLVWLLSGRGAHLGWLHWGGLVLFVVWPAIYFGVSLLVLGKPKGGKPKGGSADLRERLQGAELTPEQVQKELARLRQLQAPSAGTGAKQRNKKR